MTARPMTEGERPKLDLCPFCGGEAQARHERSGQRWHWCVVCVAPDHKCSVGPETQWFDTAAQAAVAWNRRAPSAAVRGMREALEEIQRAYIEGGNARYMNSVARAALNPKDPSHE